MRIWSISSKNVDLTNKTGLQPAKDWGVEQHFTGPHLLSPILIQISSNSMGHGFHICTRTEELRLSFPSNQLGPRLLCANFSPIPWTTTTIWPTLQRYCCSLWWLLAKVGQLWQMLLHKYAGRCWQSQVKSALFRSKTNGPASLISAQQVHWVCPRTVPCSWGKRMNIPAEPR